MSATAVKDLWAGPVLSARNIALAVLVVLIVTGTVLRVQAIGGDQRVSADEAGYAGNANRILAHEPYASFKWAPGTPFFFAVAARLSGHRSLRISAHAHGPAQDMQVLIGSFTLIVIAVIAWMLAGGWAAVLAVALTATYIPLILITRTYLSEPLGGLMFILAMLSATLARKRGLWAVGGAGAIGAMTCLSRNDLSVGIGVIALALALSGRPGWRVSCLRLGVYLGCLAILISPWVIYASERNGRFVPITTSGPNALFIGTYLPGHGEQFPTVKAFQAQVCAHEPRECGHFRAGYAAPMFRLIHSRYPHLSESAASTKAALSNLRKYALGQPFSFAGMLWEKFWRMWSHPWSGGNSGLHPDTSRPQHIIYYLLAWLGLLGTAIYVRRWELITAMLALLAVSALNTMFVAQSRDNVRFTPMLFAYGAGGLWLLLSTRMLPHIRELAQGRSRKDGAVL